MLVCGFVWVRVCMICLFGDPGYGCDLFLSLFYYLFTHLSVCLFLCLRDCILQLVTRPEFSHVRIQPCRRHSSSFFWTTHVMWVHEMTVGMRPSLTSHWAHANKSQITPLCGVRRTWPADVCPAQNSPVADLRPSVPAHSKTPPSNSIQAPIY